MMCWVIVISCILIIIISIIAYYIIWKKSATYREYKYTLKETAKHANAAKMWAVPVTFKEFIISYYVDPDAYHIWTADHTVGDSIYDSTIPFIEKRMNDGRHIMLTFGYTDYVKVMFWLRRRSKPSYQLRMTNSKARDKFLQELCDDLEKSESERR